MSIDVTVERVIARPIAEVAAYVMNPVNDVRWIRGMKHVEVLSDGPIGVGSRVERRASFLGRPIHYVYDVVEHETDAVLAMQSVAGPFPMSTRYEFASVDGGTLVRVRNRGGPGGVFGIASPLFAYFVRRQVSRDLRGLQSLLEAAGGAE